MPVRIPVIARVKSNNKVDGYTNPAEVDRALNDAKADYDAEVEVKGEEEVSSRIVVLHPADFNDPFKLRNGVKIILMPGANVDWSQVDTSEAGVENIVDLNNPAGSSFHYLEGVPDDHSGLGVGGDLYVNRSNFDVFYKTKAAELGGNEEWIYIGNIGTDIDDVIDITKDRYVDVEGDTMTGDLSMEGAGVRSEWFMINDIPSFGGDFTIPQGKTLILKDALTLDNVDVDVEGEIMFLDGDMGKYLNTEGGTIYGDLRVSGDTSLDRLMIDTYPVFPQDFTVPEGKTLILRDQLAIDEDEFNIEGDVLFLEDNLLSNAGEIKGYEVNVSNAQTGYFLGYNDISNRIEFLNPTTNINGTLNSTFGIDIDAEDHILLKNVNGELQIRNESDSAFANLRINDLYVEGTSTVVETTSLAVTDNSITLNVGAVGTPTQNGEIIVDRGDEDDARFLWNEAADRWEAGTVGAEKPLAFKGDIVNLIDDDLTGSNSTWSSQKINDEIQANSAPEAIWNELGDSIYYNNPVAVNTNSPTMNYALTVNGWINQLDPSNVLPDNGNVGISSSIGLAYISERDVFIGSGYQANYDANDNTYYPGPAGGGEYVDVTLTLDSWGDILLITEGQIEIQAWTGGIGISAYSDDVDIYSSDAIVLAADTVDIDTDDYILNAVGSGTINIGTVLNLDIPTIEVANTTFNINSTDFNVTAQNNVNIVSTGSNILLNASAGTEVSGNLTIGGNLINAPIELGDYIESPEDGPLFGYLISRNTTFNTISAVVDTSATTDLSITISKNGTAIETLTIPAGSSTGSVSLNSGNGIPFQDGDRFLLESAGGNDAVGLYYNVTGLLK